MDFKEACLEAKQKCQRAAKMGEVKVLSSVDQWIEDELQWGYTETPRCRLHVALHMHRQRPLAWHVRGLLAPGVGYFRAFDYSKFLGSSLNYGGNLEVTPPTTAYPFGRVYFGSTPGHFTNENPDQPRQIGKEFQEFFKRQKRHPSDATALQEPIDLSTSWLAVGHVDELVSFVPANNKRGFVLLWASPELGMDLLKSLRMRDQQQDPKYLDEKKSRYLYDFGFLNVQSLLEGDVSKASAPPRKKMSFLQWDLVTYNLKVAEKIKKNVAILQRALDLADDETKAVPVLFYNLPEFKGVWAAVALTPGLVNLSSMGQSSLVPDPFIPVFKDNIIQTLKQIGQMPLFIDDWETYHIADGEVHCGSNMQREPFAQKWWK
jgi:protein-arginine deiminase